MNQIGLTKNGLLLLVYTQFIILFVVCMPICSTGIVKREINTSNTTKLIWQPKKIDGNNTSAINVTTTAATTTTITTSTTPTTTTTLTTSTTPTITKSTTLTPTTTTTLTTPKARTSITLRARTPRTPTTPRAKTTSTTTEKLTTKATTEKYAEIIVKENLTVTNSQPVNDKNNLDDDAELINLGDIDGTTTEDHHFDLSRYTSDYNGNDNENSDYNGTHQQLSNDNESDADEQLSTYHIDYDHNLKEMVLTTPETSYFDEKHKEYDNDKSFERFRDDSDRINFTSSINDPDTDDQQYNPDTYLNDIHGNSTEERKQSIYLNEAEVESTNYDTSASEMKNRTMQNNTVVGEKRAKFMQEGSHVNLTIPDGAEVWALASMKNVEHSKNKQGQFYNVTTVQKEPDNLKNGTSVTKQLADWVEVMKNSDFTNNSYATETNNTSLETNNTSLETNNTSLLTSNTSQPTNNTSRPTNTTFRGSVKFQSKPLKISDRDSASQENQIIAVRLTTLPPPIVLVRSYTKTTQPSTFILPNDSENKINIQQMIDLYPITHDQGITEMTTTETEDMDTTTVQTDMTRNVDNSQNELKTKFINSNITATKLTTEKEFESKTHKDFDQTTNKDFDQTTHKDFDQTTHKDLHQTTHKYLDQTTHKDFDQTTLKDFDHTTHKDLDQTTEFEEDTSFVDSETESRNEVLSTTPFFETTTLLVTNEPEDNTVHPTSEMELVSTTNHIDNETDAITEVDEDNDEHTMYEQTSTISFKRPITTDQDILQTQSSTLQPQYVEIEKTTEMKKPTTEFVRTSTDFVQPTTEFNTKMENKAITFEHWPDTDSKEELTTTIINFNRDEYKYSTVKSNQHLDESTTQVHHSPDAIPEVIDDFTQNQEHPTTGSQIPDIGGYSLDAPDTNAIIAISISVVGVVVLAVGLGVLYFMRKRQKQLSYGQRCRPVGMDAYSLDNVSVYNSVRRKGVLRASKRSYGNAAFDDPGLKNNLLSGASLAAFAHKRSDMYEEFKELPSVTARAEEVPVGCEDKNRYANIIPLPESRVFLKRMGDDERTEYINANYVKGPKDNSHYYIACQAPLESTVTDFWRMIWEQNSRVIIMATDLIENGIEQCAEYLPPSFVIDNHVTFGDFNITLKNREVKEKYAMSMVHLKNTNTNTWREITHFWYQWPDTGVPTEQASLIGLLLEARSYLKVSTAEQMDNNENSQSKNGNLNIGNDSADKSKSLLRTQGPLTVHCSPGTGRTGTIIACDIALRALEQPTRSVDIPQIVYFVRRGRASAVRTREQYEFIYKVANAYAAKLTGPITEN